MHTHTPLCPHTLEALFIAASLVTAALASCRALVLWRESRTRTADA
ncbi:MAG: hypothetical protein AAFU38_08670 [Bacteroidota bacterium]